MADLSKVTLPDSTTVNIKDSTARQAIDDAVTMTFADVATSGSYNDLSNKPTIPTVTLNGTSTTSPSFYAPTSAGTSGQVLTSNGSGAPTWQTPQSGSSGPWEAGEGTYSAQLADTGADASGDYSVAEGSGLTEEEAYDIFGEQEAMAAPEASGIASHAEGIGTTASGIAAHAEGVSSVASGNGSHADSGGNASGEFSHSEGMSTSSGAYSHSEGQGTEAHSTGSHSEGYASQAYGYGSHAEGYITITNNRGEHASGQFNSSTQTTSFLSTDGGNTQFSVGVGTGSNARSNALEIMQNGDMYVKGVGSYTGTYASSGIKSLQTVLSEKQATLVSGTNIKTINSESLLGSGNLTISGGVTDVRLSDGTSLVSNGIATIPNELPSVDSTDNDKVLTVVNGAWAASTPAAGITGVGVNEIRAMTKAEFDALSTKVSTTVYIVTE